MIKGYLSNFGFVNTIPAPAVQGFVYLLRLNKNVGWTHFLIDTGASSTCLHGPIAFSLQSNLHGSPISTSCGIGGDGKYYTEDALLILTGKDRNPLAFSISLLIQKSDPQGPPPPPLPSLLGRNILNQVELTVNLSHSKVLMVPLPKKRK